MHTDRKEEARRMAETRLGFTGYLLYGKLIVPETKPGDPIPTIVGYLFTNGVATRRSAYQIEQIQIREFERQVREKGLTIVAESSP